MTNPEDMQNEIDELENRCNELEDTVDKFYELVSGLQKDVSALDVKTMPLTMIGSHTPTFHPTDIHDPDAIRSRLNAGIIDRSGRYDVDDPRFGRFPIQPDKYTQEAMKSLTVENLRAAVAEDVKIIDGK